jgi:hypothetical protein
VQAIAKQDVNTRKGPGLEYPIAQKMTKDTKATVVGKNSDGKWLQLAFPDAANPSWVSATFLTVSGPADTLQVVAVTAAATATRGAPAPTKGAVATATVAVPPAHGGLGFVFYEDASTSYVVGNITVESHASSGFIRIGGPRAGGGPFDIRQSTSVAPFSWAPDGSKLAYVFSQSGTVDDLRYAPGSNLSDSKSLAGHVCVSSPVWMDSKTVVYIGMDGKDCTIQKIYKVGADSSGKHETFTDDVPNNESLRGLSWGPFLLYVSNKSGAQEIWRLNQDGHGAAQITTDGKENGSPAWSPDGTKFAYYSKQASGYQIMVRNADGSNPRALTNTGHNFSPVWSQDGNWIAFMSDRGGRADVYIMDKNGGRVQLLTDKTPVGGLLPGSWR